MAAHRANGVVDERSAIGVSRGLGEGDWIMGGERHERPETPTTGHLSVQDRGQLPLAR